MKDEKRAIVIIVARGLNGFGGLCTRAAIFINRRIGSRVDSMIAYLQATR